MTVKPLPCPYCGFPPVIHRSRFRAMKPTYSCTHVSGRYTLCNAIVDMDLYREFDKPSDAIKDWNRYVTMLHQQEGFDPWGC